MEDYILIAILALALGAGVYYTLLHFKGKGGCCGGGTYRPRRKKLRGATHKKVFLIGGMRCEGCKNRVEETVNDIDGASGRVNLKKGRLTVLYAKDIPDDIIRARIEKAGYTFDSQKV